MITSCTLSLAACVKEPKIVHFPGGRRPGKETVGWPQVGETLYVFSKRGSGILRFYRAKPVPGVDAFGNQSFPPPDFVVTEHYAEGCFEVIAEATSGEKTTE